MRSPSLLFPFAFTVLIGLFVFCSVAVADQASPAPSKKTPSNTSVTPTPPVKKAPGTPKPAPPAPAKPAPGSANTTPPPKMTPASASVAPPAVGAEQPKPQIVAVKVEDPKNPKNPLEFGLGKTILITFAKDNLEILQAKKTDKNKLELFLNGNPIVGLEPVSVLSDPDSLRFYLSSTSDNRSTWNELYGRKARGGKGADKVSVAVGIHDQSLVAESPTTLTLEYLPDTLAKGILALSFVILIATVLLGWLTSMLRDSGAPRSDKKRGTFSLARFQMALWFVTIVFAFLFLYAVTGEAPPITQGVLILMGIGAGTALGASAIDQNAKAASSADLVKFAAEKQARQQEINDLQQKIAAAAATDPNRALLQQQLQAAQDRLSVVNAQLAQTPNPEVAASEGFIKDILTDVNGISFHRLQILGWMLVFWFMFVSALFTKLTMTGFDTTQLALMGISGSTYLGFKLTEKQA